MSDTTKSEATRDEILTAISRHLERNEGRHTPGMLRDLAEAYALTTGQITSVEHTHATVKS